MVIASNGRNTIKISKRTYEKVFKKMGYFVMKDEAGNHEIPEDTTAEKVVGTEQEEDAESPMAGDEETDVDSIPISEMNVKQLKEFAAKHNIDVSEAKNTAQARKIIQREIRNRNM